jgi:hypothetical protein
VDIRGGGMSVVDMVGYLGAVLVALTFYKRWSRLSEQNLRVDKWNVCRG